MDSDSADGDDYADNHYFNSASEYTNDNDNDIGSCCSEGEISTYSQLNVNKGGVCEDDNTNNKTNTNIRENDNENHSNNNNDNHNSNKNKKKHDHNHNNKPPSTLLQLRYALSRELDDVHKVHLLVKRMESILGDGVFVKGNCLPTSFLMEFSVWC